MTFTMHATKKLARGAIIAMTAVALAGPALAAKGGNGNGNGRGNSANAQSGEKGNNGRGAIASELKGLNAAHANINRMMNANPESQVGQIHAYQQAIQGAMTAGEDAEFWAGEYERLSLLSSQEIIDTFGAYDPLAYDSAVANATGQVAYYEGLILGGDLTQETADALLFAEIEAARLASLSEDEKSYEFTAGYAEALLEADANYILNSDLQAEQEAIADGQLLELTGGEVLSEYALNEFLRLHGLIE